MPQITAYLNFDGNCQDAISFYQQCLGGELSVMRFGDDMGQGKMPPGTEGRIMHAHLAGDGWTLMASDTMPGTPYTLGNSISLMHECESDGQVDELFGRLGAGGHEIMAPHDAFWGSRFAMFTDRFGINWMLGHDQRGNER